MDWVKLIEDLKIKLGTEEGPLEEITQTMIENYFVDKLNPETCTTTYIFDSFPFDEKDKDGKDRYFLTKFLKKI